MALRRWQAFSLCQVDHKPFHPANDCSPSPNPTQPTHTTLKCPFFGSPQSLAIVFIIRPLWVCLACVQVQHNKIKAPQNELGVTSHEWKLWFSFFQRTLFKMTWTITSASITASQVVVRDSFKHTILITCHHHCMHFALKQWSINLQSSFQ